MLSNSPIQELTCCKKDATLSATVDRNSAIARSGLLASFNGRSDRTGWAFASRLIYACCARSFPRSVEEFAEPPSAAATVPIRSVVGVVPTWRLSVSTRRSELVTCAIQDLVEFATIQPYAAALGAVVNLHAVAVRDRKCASIYGTVHGRMLVTRMIGNS